MNYLKLRTADWNNDQSYLHINMDAVIHIKDCCTGYSILTFANDSRLGVYHTFEDIKGLAQQGEEHDKQTTPK